MERTAGTGRRAPLALALACALACALAACALAPALQAQAGVETSSAAWAASSKTSISKATVKLSSTSYAYTGGKKTPSVTVTYKGKTLKRGTHYTVSYSSSTRKAIGTYKVTIKGKGSYKGSVKRAFRIVPPTAKLSSASSTTIGTLTAKWSKACSGVYYQLAYRKAGSSTWKRASSTTSLSKSLKGLSSGTTYYVKVRACKKKSGELYYGAWSAAKKATVRGLGTATVGSTVELADYGETQTISWSKVSGATGYEVKVYARDGSDVTSSVDVVSSNAKHVSSASSSGWYSRIVVSGGSSKTLTVETGKNAYCKYYYKVRAIAEKWSGTSSATTYRGSWSSRVCSDTGQEACAHEDVRIWSASYATSSSKSYTDPDFEVYLTNGEVCFYDTYAVLHAGSAEQISEAYAAFNSHLHTHGSIVNFGTYKIYAVDVRKMCRECGETEIVAGLMGKTDFSSGLGSTYPVLAGASNTASDPDNIQLGLFAWEPSPILDPEGNWDVSEEMQAVYDDYEAEVEAELAESQARYFAYWDDWS